MAGRDGYSWSTTNRQTVSCSVANSSRCGLRRVRSGERPRRAGNDRGTRLRSRAARRHDAGPERRADLTTHPPHSVGLGVAGDHGNRAGGHERHGRGARRGRERLRDKAVRHGVGLGAHPDATHVASRGPTDRDARPTAGDPEPLPASHLRALPVRRRRHQPPGERRRARDPRRTTTRQRSRR